MVWEPLTTTNIISLVQIAVVLFGFIFSIQSLKAARESIVIASKSLDETRKSIEIGTGNLQNASKSFELSTANAQAQLYNQMVIQGRDLQYKFSDIFYGQPDPANQEKRQDAYTGTVISYYAACFGLRNILNLPKSVTKLFDDELKQLLRQAPFRRKWEDISPNFSKEFIEYVNSLKGV